MRKYIRRVVPLIMLLVWLCTVTAFAADTPTVTYDSAKGTFTFQNLDNDGLFGAFQDLMPGDERTAEIHIEMKNISRTARLYLRAEPNNSDSTALEALTLCIRQNDTVLEEANGVNCIRQDALLGTFSGSGSTMLEVTLTVPATVGNELAEQTGELQWIFTVQEEGGETIVVPVPVPDTGDPGIVLRCCILLLVSGMLLLVLVFQKKKES